MFGLRLGHFAASLAVMNLESYVEALRARLRDAPATRDRVAVATNGQLSTSWVAKFAAGRMRNPRVDSLITLDRALSRLDAARDFG